MTDPVTVERDGHVLLIGVNRPAQRNAFDLAVIEALGAAYETLGTDQELRAGVLFGHGDHFSAGLDLAQVGPVVAQDGPGALGGSHRFDPGDQLGQFARPLEVRPGRYDLLDQPDPQRLGGTELLGGEQEAHRVAGPLRSTAGKVVREHVQGRSLGGHHAPGAGRPGEISAPG